MQVEHELRQRALEPRQLPVEDDEARPRHARRALEVHLSEAFADLEMGARGKGEGARRADALHFYIAGFVGAVGRLGSGGVGQAAHGFGQPGFEGAPERLALAQTVAEGGDLGHGAGGVLAPGLRGADALRGGVAPGAQLLRGGDGVAALAVEGEQFGRRRAGAAPGHRGVESGRVGAHGRDIEHRPSLA